MVNNHGDRKSPFRRVVGPLPNGHFIAYKSRDPVDGSEIRLTTWDVKEAANHLGCKKTVVNNWINYLSLKWLTR